VAVVEERKHLGRIDGHTVSGGHRAERPAAPLFLPLRFCCCFVA
jgi:hypothetical protein